MDYKYSMLGSVMDNYHKKPLLLQVDNMPINLFAVLKVKQELPKRLSTLGCFRRISLYSFVVVVAVMFLIMASYILTGDRKGLLLTPSPYHLSGLAVPGPFTFNLSSLKDDAHIKLVVKSITSKVEFQSNRQIPETKTLVRSESHIFSVIHRKFLPGIKNPCWYEEYSGNITLDPYRTNMYDRRAKRLRTQELQDNFKKHLVHQDGKMYRMRCLPYFYIIGQPKCGTTDLYARLKLHPEVLFSTIKEPHWWTRRRFGMNHPNEGLQEPFPVEDYLDLFDQAAYQIQGSPKSSITGRPRRPNIITGEASASTMWDNNAWVYFYDNHTTRGEPPFLTQDLIHAIQPDTRFIVMLRDPVERLYSDYLYFGNTNKSAEDFHDKVSESLQIFDGCLTEYSLRSCVYNITVTTSMPVRLHVGLYIVYLIDWLTVVSWEQILVLRLEDHASNRKYTMQNIFHFLNLGPLTKELETKIMKNPASNTRKPADKNLGPMLSTTKKILQEFHTPFNMKLAKVMNNDSFLWKNKL
ncbi:carbohydrate sulfotransferase 15 isoform X2 [Cynoglossus semilaevis]|uniref:Carbohydrate sulfotransferase 15 n=2 Tax=Cynoglossus semilaevis TaxID=244447 RepID=A0A3P8WSF0_CYNSE|nr:carbohydrate sulfotransferase 15 isoform X2 [Cynoglossus semilaevis]